MPLPFPTRTRRRHRPAVAAAAFLLVFAGCGGDGPPSGPPAPSVGTIQVSAALAGSAIRQLTVSVTGPGITTPIVRNAAVPDNATSVDVLMDVPVGGARTFSARGQDASGEFTHEGLATVTVHAGSNPAVPVTLYPIVGGVPVTIGVGTYGISVTPSTVAPMAVGAEVTLAAAVTDAASHAVPNVFVIWGSLNPAVATAGGDGVVRALAPGRTTIYASYQGAVTSLEITVSGAVGGFREISAALSHTCALDQRGFAWCWGSNYTGQLGDGSWTSRSVPVAVAGGLRFSTIATGDAHTCAVTVDGEGYCWGANFFGQLGNNASPRVPAITPQRVVGTQRWRSMHLGGAVSCGITTSGEGWCWGIGDDGHIGLSGPAEYPSAATFGEPRRVTEDPGPWQSFDIVPMLSCGVTANGRGLCTQDYPSLITTASAAGVTWRAIQLNDRSYTLGSYTTGAPFACGLTTAGEVRCWGHGEYGALGGTISTAEDVTAPRVVYGDQGYEALGVGSRFACGLRGGAAFCWGRNDQGQVGFNASHDRSVPTPVSGSHAFTRLTVGDTHACGIRVDGAALCWGSNLYGQLGDGTVAMHNLPVEVVLPAAVRP